MQKFLSVENEFRLKEGILLNSYFFLKRIAQKDQSAFGLDKNDVVVEMTPLIYQPVEKEKVKLNRIVKH